jgi:hypothetical protein
VVAPVVGIVVAPAVGIAVAPAVGTAVVVPTVGNLSATVLATGFRLLLPMSRN